jgi:hypothetical protein
MTGNDFSLNFICSLFPLLFFLNSSLVLNGLGVRLNFSQDISGNTSGLFQETTGFSNLQITMWKDLLLILGFDKRYKLIA